MMDNEIVKILASNGCKYMATDYKELIEEIVTFVKEREKAINYTQCSTLLPDELEPVLAKIEHINDLGKSEWHEVVYYADNWRSFSGSKTFEDGEKVIKWNYCKAIV